MSFAKPWVLLNGDHIMELRCRIPEEIPCIYLKLDLLGLELLYLGARGSKFNGQLGTRAL